MIISAQFGGLMLGNFLLVDMAAVALTQPVAIFIITLVGSNAEFPIRPIMSESGDLYFVSFVILAVDAVVLIIAGLCAGRLFSRLTFFFARNMVLSSIL